jgi:hypothetical protein
VDQHRADGAQHGLAGEQSAGHPVRRAVECPAHVLRHYRVQPGQESVQVFLGQLRVVRGVVECHQDLQVHLTGMQPQQTVDKRDRVEGQPAGGQRAGEVVARRDIGLRVPVEPRRCGRRRDRAEARCRQRTVRDNQPGITPAVGRGVVGNRPEQP